MKNLSSKKEMIKNSFKNNIRHNARVNEAVKILKKLKESKLERNDHMTNWFK